MHLHHLALRTHDLEPLRNFYVDVLGLPERSRQRDADGALRSIWLAAGSVVVMLEVAGAGESLPASGGMDLVAFGIAASARADYVARLAIAGVRIESTTEHTVYVRDPDGRRVGLSSYRFDGETDAWSCAPGCVPCGR